MHAMPDVGSSRVFHAGGMGAIVWTPTLFWRGDWPYEKSQDAGLEIW